MGSLQSDKETEKDEWSGAYNRTSIPLWADSAKRRRLGCSRLQLYDHITLEMKSCKGSSGIQSMTWVHGKLINTANPLDLFQLTVLARMMWDMQLTKASGWLTPRVPPLFHYRQALDMSQIQQLTYVL